MKRRLDKGFKYRFWRVEGKGHMKSCLAIEKPPENEAIQPRILALFKEILLFLAIKPPLQFGNPTTCFGNSGINSGKKPAFLKGVSPIIVLNPFETLENDPFNQFDAIMKNVLFVMIFAFMGTLVFAQGPQIGPSPVVSSIKAERTGVSTGQVEIKISGVNASNLPPTSEVVITGSIIPGGAITTRASVIRTRVGSNPGNQVIFVSNFPIHWTSTSNGPEFVEVQFRVYDGSERKLGICCMMP